MWSQSSRARARRVLATIGQAASIGSFLWVAVPLLAPLLALIVAFALGHSWIAAYAAGAMSMLLLLILVLMYPLHQTMRRIFYGFRFRDVEIVLEIDSEGLRRHTRSAKFLSRIVRTGVRHLPDRYCCPGPPARDSRSASQSARRPTGHAQARPPSHAPRVIAGDARILGPIYDQLDECWNYQMDLGGALSAGTDREIQLVQDLDFTKVGYGPRLQRTILDPTDHLLLVLRLPANYWPINAEGEEMLPGDRPRKIPVTIDDSHREVRLEVSRPRFGSIYRIRWSPVGQVPGVDDSRLEAAPEARDRVSGGRAMRS